MPDIWTKCKLGDMITLKRGYDLPNQQRRDGEVPIVSSSGVSAFHDEAKVEGPGVVTGRYGTLGEVFYIETAYWPLNTSLYVQDFKGNDPRFISYFLRTLNFGNQNVAGAVPGVNRNVLHMMSVSKPPLSTQRKIAAILSAYDNLIENNNRRIKVLEEMAQAVYKEWFTYPFRGVVGTPSSRPSPTGRGRRKAGEGPFRLVKSKLGMIPEGWEVKQIGEVIETLGGGTPSTKEFAYWDDGDINWYTPSDLTEANSLFIEESSKKKTASGLDNSSAKLFPAYSVMMTSRATIGVLSINTQPACTNQGFITCIPNQRLSAYHIYFWIDEIREDIIRMASGATFKEISRGEFRELPIILPSIGIEEAFKELVKPLGRQIDTLLCKNNNLRKTRDLLLPKLICGEIDVERINV